MRRVLSVALVAGLGVACSGRKLDEAKLKTLLEAKDSFMSDYPELRIASEAESCAYFTVVMGTSLSIDPDTCRWFRAFGRSSSGRIAFVLPDKNKRRIKLVGAPAINGDEATAKVTWEWDTSDWSQEEVACFEMEPVESMAILRKSEGEWQLKEVVSERVVVEKAKCP